MNMPNRSRRAERRRISAELGLNLMENEHIKLGVQEGWGTEAPFSISCDDRLRHALIIGATGTGKSTLLENMAVQDINAGRGLAFIDPHGDSAEFILECIPRRRVADTVYICPADFDYPTAFNVLAKGPRFQRDLVVSGIVSAFKGIWSDSWGPRLEYVFAHCIAALLDCENVTLLGVPRLLTDSGFRHWVLKQVQNPVVRTFWLTEFARYDTRLLNEIISPILNKIGRFLMSGCVRNILGQVVNRIRIRQLMDSEKIVIINLAKGKIGSDKAHLLGALCMSQFEFAAMSRAELPREARRSFTIYADEYSSYTSESFISILSEIRKYGIGMVLATQLLGKSRPEITSAVLGNVGSIVSFRVGPEEAETMQKAFGGSIMAGQFASLPNRKVFGRILLNGEYREPLSGRTYPPTGKRYGRALRIIRHSRSRYAAPRKVVERKINSWLGLNPL